MLTTSWSSWTPERPGGALRGIIDHVTDKGTHQSGEQVWRCAHRHATEADAGRDRMVPPRIPTPAVSRCSRRRRGIGHRRSSA